MVVPLLVEGHIDVKRNINLSEVEKIRNNILFDKFRINHITLQIEYNSCKDKKIVKNHPRVIT